MPPKSAQVNFLWGKNDIRTAIQQFNTPIKTLYPHKKKQISGYAPGRLRYVSGQDAESPPGSNPADGSDWMWIYTLRYFISC